MGKVKKKHCVWEDRGYDGGPGSRLWEKGARTRGVCGGMLLWWDASLVAWCPDRGPLMLCGGSSLLTWYLTSVTRAYQNQALLVARELGP